MATYQPAYRLTVYAPRSVDATETTILTPIGGAPHGDQFKVITLANVAGWKPYLDLPRGRQGSIDPLSKKLTQGSLSLRILDKRTTAGGSNASRWVTAFIGDASGKHRLVGCKFLLEESLNGGSSWSSFFTGRIYDLSRDSKLWYTLQVRDLSDDLNKRVFVGRPHSSITYAFLPALTPLGLPQAWGNFAAVARLKGTIHRISSTKARLTIDTGQDPWSRIATAMAFGQLTQPWQVVLTSGGNTGIFIADPLKTQYETGTFKDAKTWHQAFSSFEIDEQAASAPGYLAMPADLAAVTFYATIDMPPTKDFPLLVGDIHPVQLLADMIDGKFSKLKSDGSAIALAARENYAGWTTGDPWKPLIDDTSFGKMRLAIDQLWKLNEITEKAICQVYQLAYRLNGAGKVEIIDLRRTSVSTSSGTITDSDLVTGETPSWNISRDSAMTGAEITYYVDEPISPLTIKDAPDPGIPYPPTGIQSTKAGPIFVVNDLSTLGDLGERTLKIDALGLRFSRSELGADNALQTEVKIARDRIVQWAQDALTPYATAAAKLHLRCRRGTSQIDTCFPGQRRAVQVTTQPNPLTNLLSGTRLMLCVGRSEDGPTIDLDVIDMGQDSAAATPSITSAAVASNDSQALDVAVTLNAAGDRAIVEYNVTATSVGTVPGAGDPGWLRGATYFTSTTQRITALPQGARVWLRARSYPIGSNMKLPSAYVFLGAPGYVDMAAITAPSSVTSSNLFANRVDLSWTNADTTRRVEILRVAGGAPGSWSDSNRIASLDPGSTKYRAVGLATSTQYTFGVRLRDDFGGVSSVATLTLTTGGTPGVAPKPVGLDVAIRAS